MNRSSCILIAAFVYFINQAHGETPISFEHYKQLSKEERVKLNEDAPDQIKLEYFEWEQRLKMGEEGWREHQEARLVRQKGFDGLSQLFNTQSILWGRFYQQSLDQAAKGRGVKRQAQSDQSKPIFDQLAKHETELYKDRFWYLVKLAKTEEAFALNVKAESLYAKWSLRFPVGEIHLIKRSDLSELDADVEQIRHEMMQLPQWTSEQEDAAIEALPPESPSRDWPVRGKSSQ